VPQWVTLPVVCGSRKNWSVNRIDVTEAEPVARLHHVATCLWDFGEIVRSSSSPHERKLVSEGRTGCGSNHVVKVGRLVSLGEGMSQSRPRHSTYSQASLFDWLL